MEKKAAISREELNALFDFRKSFRIGPKAVLRLVGFLLTPITLLGALLGYIWAYWKFKFPLRESPNLQELSPTFRFIMTACAVLIWAAVFIAMSGFGWFSKNVLKIAPTFIVSYLAANIILSLLLFIAFRMWQGAIEKHFTDSKKFGSARFASAMEVAEYEMTAKTGIYIGDTYCYSDNGHFLTVAGTRGGKGVNLIIPNLLGHGGYSGSWVVIDPKGENAAITARYQRESGQNVVILNPWGLLPDHIMAGRSYNPLDILSDRQSVHLVDDIAIIAEMIVPNRADDRDNFFNDNARSVISGLLLHLMTSDVHEKNLVTLWKWLRLEPDRWAELVADMRVNDDPVNGLIVQTAGSEIMKLMAAGERTFGSILGVALQCTAFLNSPSLQASLVSDFDPKELADGKATLYVIIPADKLQSHSRWLRLVVTSTMRAIIRKPNKRVTFLLDEFAALGYMSEIETALSTYAGYNVSVWAILQTLTQLNATYGRNWETFIANTAVRQYFSISDNFTAEYISKAMGMSSNVRGGRSFLGIWSSAPNPRPLITPDELRRESGKDMFVIIQDKPPVIIPKRPYYLNSILKSKADRNPYFS